MKPQPQPSIASLFITAQLATLRSENERMRNALAYIARGYSGTVGNAEGHSGTHCAEHAAAILRELGKA